MPRQLLRLLLIAGLFVMAAPAFALGLGRIEVKSQHGQPLLAEIPVVSSDPAELRRLQARLASPDTFARIGLDPPQGLVSDLQFNVALDASGRPVIRVTSLAPVQQEALTFLVEVDWGQGRLVREYSALVAVPDTVAAPTQPAVQAPEVAAPATIVRAPTPPVTPIVASTPAPAAAPAAERPVNDDTAVAPTPTPAAAPAPVAASAARSPAVAASLPPVERGQTLSALAAPLVEQGDISVNQAMLLLLRANPDAFISGNLNLIKQGAVLRVPPQATWSQYSNAEAAAVVREQIGQWREMRRPAPAPVAAIATQDAESSPETPAVAAATTPARAASNARLEITPPSADGQQAGTQSGIDAGGGGDMLRQELQQANENVAARTAEIDELKARLADLEQLQQQQSQLIEMKDAELAAAQQRMADSNAQSQVVGGFPWIWLGVALLVVGLLAFLLGRRGSSATTAVTKKPVGFAAGTGAGTAVASTAPAQAETEPASVPTPAFASAAPVAPPAAPVAAPATSVPAWHAGDVAPPTVAAVEAPAIASFEAEVPDASAPVVADRSSSDAQDDLPSASVERIELARAYIELGDLVTARGLLQEVIDGRDAAASADAMTLLRTLD